MTVLTRATNAAQVRFISIPVTWLTQENGRRAVVPRAISLGFENVSGVAGPIEGLTWWGLDLMWISPNWYECEEYDNTFQISFHEDAGGVPGSAVCSYTLEAARTPTGILYTGAELNEYSVTLPEPCVLVNGWVSIVGLGDPECWFMWMSSGDGSGQSYCDGCATPWQSDDLSVCLIGSVGGVFGACCDDVTGDCGENVEIVNCLGADQRFVPDGTCDDLDPPCGVLTGACQRACQPDRPRVF